MSAKVPTPATSLSYLKSVQADYIEDLYARYLANPDSPDAIDASWKYFFDGMSLTADDLGLSTTAEQTANLNVQVDWDRELRVYQWIENFRRYGFLIAHTNPLADPPALPPQLQIETYGLTQADLEKPFHIGKMLGLAQAPLSKIRQHLTLLYAGSIGIETHHIADAERRIWVQTAVESQKLTQPLAGVDQQFVLKRLTEAVLWEQFLHTRYVAQKRFSLEGGEGLIPALDRLFETAAELGVTHVCMGMAHRGRLNVLVNTMGKKPEYIFTDFDEGYLETASPEDLKTLGAYDVKYHMGFESDRSTRQGHTLHLLLAYNPSHLEFVNPVVEGIAKAKQHVLADTSGSKVLPVLIHGDAAFSGQGVVFETMTLSELDASKTGGTVHIVIDNQVGFTADADQVRSTRSCVDPAKFLETPIFHVNGDDAESLWNVMDLAMRYRHRFKQDVFINIICYRKYGHNEGDEPGFTQPLMYQKIKTHPNPRDVYQQRVGLDASVKEWDASRIAELTAAQERTKAQKPVPHTSAFEGRWKNFRTSAPGEMTRSHLIKTGVEAEKLRALSKILNTQPASFHLHSKLQRFFENRLQAVTTGIGIDWGNAESLATASLLVEGHCVRLSGQDVERGTFTHRHSVLHDTETGEIRVPLNTLDPKQAPYFAYNSALSETGVMGFEYGWSLVDPTSLVIWEAQFGDFSNGAQVIIDQFLAAGESKWRRSSGLVLLLPHAYEGQGAEHSSARLERFLQLSALDNWYVCNLSTPAQIFHALRRQIHQPFRKPLVVMSPKSLLRNPLAVSSLTDLSEGSFQEIIDDSVGSAKQVVLCSGKFYYDLWNAREKNKRTDVALVRVEQLYPWNQEGIDALLKKYSGAKKWVWAQEEPKNMGAWTHVFLQWSEMSHAPDLAYVGRAAASSPAVGQHHVHDHQQEEIVEKVFKS